jgi:hypothetical protein
MNKDNTLNNILFLKVSKLEKLAGYALTSANFARTGA